MTIYTRTNYIQTLIKQPPSGKYVLRRSHMFFFCFQPIKSFALALLVFSRASRGSRWPGVLSIMSDQPRNDGTTISNRPWPTWRNDSCHFLFLCRIRPQVKSTEEKKGNDPVCQNGTASISVPSVRPIRDHLCRWS